MSSFEVGKWEQEQLGAGARRETSLRSVEDIFRNVGWVSIGMIIFLD